MDICLQRRSPRRGAAILLFSILPLLCLPAAAASAVAPMSPHQSAKPIDKGESATGQDAPAGLTMAQAVAAALARHPDIAAAQAEVKAAAARTRQAEARPDPSLGFGTAAVPFNLNKEDLGTAEIDLGLEQTFEFPGKRKLRVDDRPLRRGHRLPGARADAAASRGPGPQILSPGRAGGSGAGPDRRSLRPSGRGRRSGPGPVRGGPGRLCRCPAGPGGQSPAAQPGLGGAEGAAGGRGRAQPAFGPAGAGAAYPPDRARSGAPRPRRRGHQGRGPRFAAVPQDGRPCGPSRPPPPSG